MVQKPAICVFIQIWVRSMIERIDSIIVNMIDEKHLSISEFDERWTKKGGLKASIAMLKTKTSQKYTYLL